MNGFLLIIMLAGASSAQPLYVDRLPTMAECQSELAKAVKQIPTDVQIDYAAVCTPIKNATEQAL